MILDEKPSILLDSFLNGYLPTQSKTYDRNHIDSLIKRYTQFFDKRPNADCPEEVSKLENRWYGSNCTDFDIYDDDYYFADIWLCFLKFSRKHLKQLSKPNTVGFYRGYSFFDISKTVKTILDLGCGISYSTISLREQYPNATVTATNLRETKQWDFCSLMAQKHGFDLVGDISEISCDQEMVFASEYFEHINNPIEHLQEVLYLNPKYLVIANSFNTKGIGHFKMYKNGKMFIPENKIGRMFSDFLKKAGYERLKTNYWNNTPNIWMKV